MSTSDPFSKSPGAIPSDVLVDAAVDWLIRRDGGFGPGEAEQFQRWLDAAPGHAAAFAEAEAAFGRVRRPREMGRSVAAVRELDARTQQRRTRRWRGAATVVTFAAAAAVAIALRPMFRPSPVAPSVAVATVEVRPDRLVLPDSSVVQLNADAEVRVEFTAARRGIRLVRGEAYFTVAKDAARPFVVTAGTIEVRAVGTEFVVRHSPTAIDVLVTEGRVDVEHSLERQADESRVRAAAGVSVPVSVEAGVRAIIPVDAAVPKTPAVAHVSSAEIETALAWREKRIEFAGTPLGEAVELFNRQNRLQLSLGEPSLAALRISGIFWADNPASFARLLELSLNVKAGQTGERIVIRPATP